MRGIRSNLPELSSCVDEIKMIYSLTHKSIYENEMADSLAKVAEKKAAYLPPNKWARRLANSSYHKCK